VRGVKEVQEGMGKSAGECDFSITKSGDHRRSDFLVLGIPAKNVEAIGSIAASASSSLSTPIRSATP
jgi:hypothetical protein